MITYGVVLTRSLARFPLPSSNSWVGHPTRARQELSRLTLFVHYNTELQLLLLYLLRAPRARLDHLQHLVYWPQHLARP